MFSRGARGLAAAGMAVVLLACERGPAPPPTPDGARAFGVLLSQVECGPRTPNSAGAECAREQILATLRSTGARAGVQRFTLADPYGGDSLRLQNVVANFFPERPRRVLLAAHYDTRPRAERDTGLARDQPIPGANDGASGVAVLLEVAQALAKWDPGVGVDLVFFDGEDYGHESDFDHYLLGSKYFVRTMGAYRPRAVLLVDMVGERGLRIPMEGNSRARAPELTQLVFDAAAAVGATSFVREEGPTLYDDHVPFLQVGIPAVDLIDFEYPAWHTQGDTPAQCAPESLVQVAQVLLASLARLAKD